MITPFLDAVAARLAQEIYIPLSPEEVAIKRARLAAARQNNLLAGLPSDPEVIAMENLLLEAAAPDALWQSVAHMFAGHLGGRPRGTVTDC
jgi:hypothetical protein